MKRIFLQLWQDDLGAMLSVEYVLLGSITVFGVSAGAIEVRSRVNAGFQQMGSNITAMTPAIDMKALSHDRPVTSQPVEQAVPTVVQIPPSP